MADRKAQVSRKTKETDIQVAVNLDGSGSVSVSTGVGFFDHMLELLGKHGLLDLKIRATGDLQIDAHHTVEDVGICLGEAIKKALGDKRRIRRFGQAWVPMDEALAQVIVDVSGRGYCLCRIQPPAGPSYFRDELRATVEAVSKRERSVKQALDELMDRCDESQLLEEFARALAINAELTLHLNVPYGKNAHHIVEAVFKAMGRALRQAVEADARQSGVPSTKGKL